MEESAPSPAIAKIHRWQPTPRQRRRILIDMSLRRQKPGAGSSMEFIQRRTALNPWPDLRQILAGIPWVIGAASLTAYMPERMTRDMDILNGNPMVRKASTATRAGYSHPSWLSRLARIPGRGRSRFAVRICFAEALKQIERPADYPSGIALSGPMKLSMRSGSADISRMLGLARSRPGPGAGSRRPLQPAGQ
jgi:hypothetical protein